VIIFILTTKDVWVAFTTSRTDVRSCYNWIGAIHGIVNISIVAELKPKGFLTDGISSAIGKKIRRKTFILRHVNINEFG
ncbi:MAG: hypothetical protein WCJ61_05550, partial [Paludibacter sp.]